jgi:hypothetical protein
VKGLANYGAHIVSGNRIARASDPGIKKDR